MLRSFEDGIVLKKRQGLSLHHWPSSSQTFLNDKRVEDRKVAYIFRKKGYLLLSYFKESLQIATRFYSRIDPTLIQRRRGIPRNRCGGGGAKKNTYDFASQEIS